jgi:AAA domain, putative AbiEii toxin, Type IV TA system
MYINRIALKNFRTFRSTRIDFVHADQRFAGMPPVGSRGRPGIDVPPPRFPNINLLLGNNGAGKTTLLKAIAIAALGPAVVDANLPIYRLIRREPGAQPATGAAGEARIEAGFTAHEQDAHGSAIPDGTPELESEISIQRMGDVERVRWVHPEEKPWHPIYSAESDAYFFVGYGATRRVERNDRLDPGARQSSSFARAQRIRSLFEEAYSLIPLSFWLPPLESADRRRFAEVQHLIDQLLEGTGYSFTGIREQGEYLFAKGGMKIPFPALSDGYRAYLGWIGDLLYHIEQTCPSGRKLVENRGIVMVDEIDLHLHPKWQMDVLPILAGALPNLQFVVTSHSPLIVGSLEWMNIILMKTGSRQSSRAERVEWAVHGLDADQVLLSDFFGLESTRAPGRKRDLKKLALRAREGDPEAAKQLLEAMSRGTEAA